MTYRARTEPRSAHRLREGGKTRPSLCCQHLGLAQTFPPLHFGVPRSSRLVYQPGFALLKNSSSCPVFHHSSVFIREKFWVRGTP